MPSPPDEFELDDPGSYIDDELDRDELELDELDRDELESEGPCAGGPAAYATLFRDEFELDDGTELASNDDELDFEELDDRELELDDGLGDIGFLSGESGCGVRRWGLRSPRHGSS